MALTQRLRSAAGSRVQRFLDHRLRAANAPLVTAAEEAATAASRDHAQLVEDLDRRFQQLAFDLATAARAHAESVSYVATELSRLEARLGGEISALAERLVLAGAAAPEAAATDPYTVRALAPLPPGARVLVVEPGLGLAPLSLAALGYQVTAIGVQPYPLAHGNLDVVVGDVRDLPAPAPFDGLVLTADTPEAVQAALARRDELLTDRGMVVLRLAGPAVDAGGRLEGLDVVDRTVATSNGHGSWAIGRGSEPGVLLVTARPA